MAAAWGVIQPIQPPVKRIKKGGSSCHQCKSRRNFAHLTYCTSNLDNKKNKRCRKKFCGQCLKKFYKESPQSITDRATWRCPSCRKICCCAACRRRKERDTCGFPLPAKPKSTNKKKAKVNIKAVTMDSNSPHLAYPPAHLQAITPQPRYSPAPLAPPPPLEASSYGRDPLYPMCMTTMSGVLSPMSTPLNLPSEGPAEFSLLSGTFPTLNKHKGSEDLSGRLQVPSPSNYPSVLQKEIQRQAQQAASSQNNGPNQFARLYSIAQTPEVKQKIQLILGRTDISQDQKVECIAQLLRVYTNSPSVPTSSKILQQ